MKTIRITPIATAFLIVASPLLARAEIFFSDDFSGASTVNQPIVPPTMNSANYQTAIGLVNSTSSVSPNGLSVTFPNTSSVLGQALARFRNTPVPLTTIGDYLALTVVFVNTSNIMSGLDTANSTLNLGLFNSGGVNPNQGNIVTGAGNLIGGTEDWIGYIGRIFWGGSASIFTRSAQTPVAANSRNQDLLFSNASSTQAFGEPAGTSLGSLRSDIILPQGSTNTLLLVITMTDVSTLTISNVLFAGTDTLATPLFAQQRIAAGANYITAGFDGFAIGWRNASSAAQASTMTIQSIEVAGQSTVVSTPPEIVQEPVPVVVPSGASAAFSVVAQGFNLEYQWHRNGTNLLDSGNLSGARSATLIISPAGATDVASGANGYYVTVTGSGGFSTNSTTNSLTLGAARNLTWTGPGDLWDLNTSVNWVDSGSTPRAFNFGDAVTFNGNPPTGVVLSGSYLSASSVTVDGPTGYAFSGSGSFAGPGKLIFTGSFLDIGNVNTYSGGTIISNELAYLYLRNYNGLGTGPITLAKAGGTLEVVPAGSASLGINSDIIVADDFTIQFDPAGTFAGVIFGNLSGTAGKKLTLTPMSGGGVNRYRVYGANTTYDADLVLNGAAATTAVYEGTTLAPYHGTGTQTYNGVISGAGGIIQRGNGTTLLNGQNTYAGGTVPSTGTIGFGADSVAGVSGPIGTGSLFIVPELPNTTGSGTVLASGGARTISNPTQYPSGTNNQTLIIGGSNNLTFSGPITLNGNDGLGTPVNRIFQANNTGLTTLSGVLSDGGLGFGFTKTGTGILILNNMETYTGPTAVNAGTLLVNGQLDNGTVAVATNAVLGGTGTIGGAVTIQAGGAISPGNSIGTLTINNSLDLAGHLRIEVNKSANPTSDRITVSGALNNTGTGMLTVTNLGAALTAGDTFTIFNKAVANGAALTVTGENVTWTNKLAVDGTIAVLSAVAGTPPPIAFSQAGNALTLNWPASHIGWTLQSNAVSIASANWFPVPGSAVVNQFVVNLDPTKVNVFYRLVQTP